MAEPSDLVVVEADGSIRVPGRGADRRLRDRAGRYHLVVDAQGLLILRGEQGASGPRVLMAGEVVWRAWSSPALSDASRARDGAWAPRATGTPKLPTSRLR